MKSQGSAFGSGEVGPSGHRQGSDVYGRGVLGSHFQPRPSRKPSAPSDRDSRRTGRSTRRGALGATGVTWHRGFLSLPAKNGSFSRWTSLVKEAVSRLSPLQLRRGRAYPEYPAAYLSCGAGCAEVLTPDRPMDGFETGQGVCSFD